VNWITQQPYSNGKVTAYGVSYDGYNALAVAGNNPQGLESVIACSAPANAATDSFTSGRFVEKYIFSYISTDRQANELALGGIISPLIDIFSEKQVRSEIDNILLGDDLEEWTILNRAIDDQNDSYWTERSLYDVLSKTTVPILHIAGLEKDQDGRDTVLAFDHIQATSELKDNHYLVLHPTGHGCGNTNTLPVYQKMLDLSESTVTSDLSVEKKIHQYIKSQSQYVAVDSYSELPVEEKVIDIPEQVVLDDFGYMTEENAQSAQFQTEMEIPIEEELILSGAVKMDINYMSTAPQTPLHVYILFMKDGQFIGRGWRTNLITGDQTDQMESKTLIFPLMNETIPAGSVMTVYFATADSSVFYRQPEIRNQYTPADDNPAQITIFSDETYKTQVILPIEKVEKPEPEEEEEVLEKELDSEEPEEGSSDETVQ
ncbi:MAG: CocE/NonD family hydrolase, partial [Bdellovibrionales bacterium]|nr:CocE/NonD family hydrolase [Bdellovibrionales bacterium]